MHTIPSYIKRRFDIVDSLGQEKDYYPPYNSLLQEYFPSRENFSVAPVAQPLGERDSIDFTVEYIVEYSARPVMFLEIKPLKDINKSSCRKDADDQMRRRFRQLNDICADFINDLYGLSAFGTSIAIYKLERNTRRIIPAKVPDSDEYIIDSAPLRWWDKDITRTEGQDEIIKMFLEIKNRCLTHNNV